MQLEDEERLHHMLDAAKEAFSDANLSNDVAALNALNAFINHVTAQAGGKITQADADSLITDASEIILVINEQSSL